MTPANTYRIMVVDDDADMRLMMETALGVKYEVVSARDGAEALDRIDEYQPDFLIMDMSMPKMDGSQVCQAIRHHPVYHDLPVLFLSAHSSREHIMKIYECGGNLFLPKPIEPERLARNVDLFFEQTPPPIRSKKFSVGQLKERATDFPAYTAKTEKALAEHSLETSSTHSRTSGETRPLQPRLLIIEDDVDFAELMIMALYAEYEVVMANDGFEALKMISKYQPDILLVDVMLPKMNGYQICQSVRSDSHFADTKIIFVTAKASGRDREYALRMGANAFIAKPFEMEDLIALCTEMTKQPGFQIRYKTIPKALLPLYMKEVKKTPPAKEKRDLKWMG